MLRKRPILIIAPLLIALAVVVLGAAQTARAQTPAPTPVPGGTAVTDDQVNAVAGELYCPVCENVPLDVCGTQACADWREQIRTMLEQGKTVDQIKATFAEEYGQRVLATPDARGINLLVWVLPAIGVLAAVIVLVVALRRMAPGALSAEAQGARLSYDDLDPEYVARLERELKEYARH